MKTRHIEKIVQPGTPHFVGDGFRVHNFIPGTSTMQRMDPFIMLDYNSKYHFPPTHVPKGVGVHPHRGFETVTIAYKGRVEHTDSAGGGGVIGEGDVQWMTAASGVLHKEFHETEWSKTGGEFQMVQLWVNLPAKDKMSPPKYQAIANAEMAKVPLPDGAGEVEVIAGAYEGNKGPASTFSPVNMFNVRLKKGAKMPLTFPAHYTTAILPVEGSVKVNETTVVLQDHFALFANNDGDTFTLDALEDTVVLVLSGAPLNEPIAAHGPFVMNTQDELIQAFQDFNTGKFGYLED
ncbi:short-chain dehydrogenase [Mangrovimonas yunxiaonensis]|uniref:Short-chain dehydrogenase n=1 Tax=Mangrovimonas yunxiaonensis TaxID=1197477 RepID=A0A084THG7_9FLAO|nr:pirin family protein [Mangrovimonas yunxiaonensis]KFB00153.1 short-chain dehydrogenase [Mangrovimonas yunxiaonensis]GGH42218.1 quercetin 2,3-dioxygenase [Mangrovimonas yunxiaonensis]